MTVKVITDSTADLPPELARGTGTSPSSRSTSI